MNKIILTLLTVFLVCFSLSGQEGIIPIFPIESNEISLHRDARPGNPFDKVGRRFAIFADESGSFEAWAYPLKLFRGCGLSFFIGDSTRPIPAREIVRTIDVNPEAVILTYVYQSFTIRAVYITSIEQPGGIILLQVDSTTPLSIVCGFLPVLQPMWPAGLGGQYAHWDDQLKAYVISESSGKNHGLVGSPAASGLSYTPAHMLSDSPSEFRIDIPDPDLVRESWIPIIMAGGPGKREDITAVYRKLLSDPRAVYREAQSHFLRLREQTLQIRTPDRSLNLAFEWAKVTFDNLMVDNPNLGLGMVAGLGASGTSGRPGFGWFFGGDAYINNFSQNGYGAFGNIYKSLEFNLKWQRDDGKMAHELSQAHGYINWWKDYHYGYIHGDTTPYFLCALYDYVRMTGDTGFVKANWNAIARAYDWCRGTDADHNGLMDNSRAGLGALEYGDLTGVATDVYLAAVWIRAAFSMKTLAEIAGQEEQKQQAEQDYLLGREAFNHAFWNDRLQFYSYAFNSNGEQVQEISPWSAVGIMWGWGESERSRQTLERLCRPDILTDWGVRSISSKSPYYQPLNYNYGAVWPFITGWVTTAFFKNHMPQQGAALLQATARLSFDRQLGGISEVYSGFHHAWPQESVPHQGFSSAGVTLPLIRGMCGLEGSALTQTACFSPQFPANWNHVLIKNYRIGPAGFDFEFFREKEQIRVRIHSRSAQGFKMELGPVLGGGAANITARLDEKPLEINLFKTSQTVTPKVEFTMEKEFHEAVWDFSPGLEILPPDWESRTGDRNKGLKLISCDYQETELRLTVEGLSGEKYDLKVLNPETIGSIQGAELKENRLVIRIPQGNPGQFTPSVIRIAFKQSPE